MDNFNEVHDYMKSILIVALSEEIGSDENDILLQSQVHLTKLNNVIKGTMIDEQETENNDYDDYDEIVVGDWKIWPENVFMQAQEISNNINNGNIVNA